MLRSHALRVHAPPPEPPFPFSASDFIEGRNLSPIEDEPNQFFFLIRWNSGSRIVFALAIVELKNDGNGIFPPPVQSSLPIEFKHLR